MNGKNLNIVEFIEALDLMGRIKISPAQSQLRSLEEIRTANGNIDIRPARSSKDDVAIAVALAASELSEAVLDQCVPVILGGVNPVISPRYDSFGFPVGQECERFPVCLENGDTCECYGC